MNDAYRDLYVTASDGLRLYARDYGPTDTSSLPVICLSGLARNSGDFHELALGLSQKSSNPRRVLALDYRGRGKSEWAQDWQQYDVRVEIMDLLQVLDATGIDKAIFIGTSRGGLIIMALAGMKPALMKAAVLNDVGPVVDVRGLLRIRGYVGKLPVPRDFADAGQQLKTISAAYFPRHTDAQWEKLARGTWEEKQDGTLSLSYDPQLLKTLEALDLEAPLPNLWPFFEGLKPIPVLAIRGANSDLLSPETLAQMKASHPNLTTVTVPHQGHAPDLEGDLMKDVEAFIDQVDPKR